MIGRRSAVIDEARLVSGAILSAEAISRDRLDQSFSVPEEDAKLFEIAVGEFGQGFRVHRVVPECGLVLLESEAS